VSCVLYVGSELMERCRTPPRCRSPSVTRRSNEPRKDCVDVHCLVDVVIYTVLYTVYVALQLASVFMVLFGMYFFLLTSFSLPFTELSVVGLVLDLVD